MRVALLVQWRACGVCRLLIARGCGSLDMPPRLVVESCVTVRTLYLVKILARGGCYIVWLWRAGVGCVDCDTRCCIVWLWRAGADIKNYATLAVAKLWPASLREVRVVLQTTKLGCGLALILCFKHKTYGGESGF